MSGSPDEPRTERLCKMHTLTRSAESELSKFFQVAKTMADIDGTMALMPICYVDKAWHGKLQDPKGYEVFCRSANVPAFEHAEVNGFGKINWVDTYHQKYGLLGKVWFVSPEGEFDEVAFNSYLQSNELHCAWNCGPVESPKGKPSVDTVTSVSKPN